MIGDFAPPASAVALDWALAYARAGARVFRCSARKRPLTEHGLKDATTNEAQIRAWWEKWPHADIGWALGLDIVVLDLDVGDGLDGFSDFVEHAKVSPEQIRTPQASTPRGGLHMLVAANGGTYKNGVRINRAAIDVRTRGGYIIAPRPAAAASGLYRSRRRSRRSRTLFPIGPSRRRLLWRPPRLSPTRPRHMRGLRSTARAR